jgi:hypothetical protein
MIYQDWSKEISDELIDVQDETNVLVGDVPGNPITEYYQNGKKRSAQQRLDAINEARTWAIVTVLEKYGTERAIEMLNNNVRGITLASVEGGVALPSDCIKPLFVLADRIQCTVLENSKAQSYDSIDMDVVEATDSGKEAVFVVNGGKIIGVSGDICYGDIEVHMVYVDTVTMGGVWDVHEDIRWRDAIKAYAKYLCFMRTGNPELASMALVEAKQKIGLAG